jgi:hypothetical protein
VDSTSHSHTLYCKRFVRLRVLIKTHITTHHSSSFSLSYSLSVLSYLCDFWVHHTRSREALFLSQFSVSLGSSSHSCKEVSLTLGKLSLFFFVLSLSVALSFSVLGGVARKNFPSSFGLGCRSSVSSLSNSISLFSALCVCVRWRRRKDRNKKKKRNGKGSSPLSHSLCLCYLRLHQKEK